MTTNFRPVLAALVAGAALVGAAHAQGSSRLEALDTNRDGMLSRDEVQSHPHLAQRFDSIDANRDGILSRSELMAWHQQHRKGGEGEGGHGGLRQLDTNHDGQLERSEVGNDPRALARFDAADTNRDGIVTREEGRAARAAHRGTSGTPQ